MNSDQGARHGPGTGRADAARLIADLQSALGRRDVLTSALRKHRYEQGYRFGGGPAAAVVLPRTAVALWRAAALCVQHGAAIIVQAANTGLTGGSTPAGGFDEYGRPVVILNTMRLDQVRLLDGGRQVLCHAGATLYRLEAMLAPAGRDPHSVIGSSCFGASVVGGVCNNSGGALIHRGPAYTQHALYARIGTDGALELVNHLGIDLGTGDAEAMLDRLDHGQHALAVGDGDGAASDPDYGDWVRDVDADTPARFNADPRRLYEASGCAGKLIVFAVRLDTFERPQRTRVFYIGTNHPDQLTTLRRAMLSGSRHLPVAAEYMHRGAFDIADRYGRDSFLVIDKLGTNRLPMLYRLKDRLARIGGSLGLRPGFDDRLMQRIGQVLPDHLPARMRGFRDRFEHHLMLRCADEGIEEARAWLEQRLDPALADWFECDVKEGKAAFLHRFVAAGAAIRYRAVHPDRAADIVALDIALRRDDRDWVEQLPPSIDAAIHARLYYGHFFCHVFHQDYLIAPGHDPIAIEHAMWDILDRRGAQYPAEHNVGHLYPAKPALADFYRSLDPSNSLNPGIGQMSKCAHYH
jgi:D-lactate dehydrogenase